MADKIEKLTDEQVKKLEEIKNYWRDRALDCRQVPTSEAQRLGGEWSEQILGKKNPVIHVSSPFGGWIAFCLLSEGGYENWNPKRPSFSEINKNLRGLFETTWEQINSQITFKSKNPLSEEDLITKLKNTIKLFVWPYFDGHFYSNYFGWVSAYKMIGVKFDAEVMKNYDKLEACADLGLFYPTDSCLIVTSKPTQIWRNSEGRLHKDEAPAVEYSDGWKLYFLNGIAMSPKQVLTPAEKLNPKEVLKETNVDKRRELIRKIGIERMLVSLSHKVLEKLGNYELLSVNLSDVVPNAKYLKMLNPSVGVWHLEGVAPECSTIEAALKWRNSNWFTNAEKLT